jgi:hypothetical protein
VADRAVEPDEIDAAEIAFRNTDRQVLLPALVVGPVEKAEGAIIEMTVELRGKQSRQRLPDPEGDAATLVGADRPMLEMNGDVGKDLGAIACQAFCGGEGEAHRNQANHERQREQDQYRKEQTSPPAQLRFDIGDGRFGGHAIDLSRQPGQPAAD